MDADTTFIDISNSFIDICNSFSDINIDGRHRHIL